MPASRSSASSSSYAIGSLERFALVITNACRSARGKKQVLERRVRKHHAQFVISGSDSVQLHLALGASTIGRAADKSNASVSSTCESGFARHLRSRAITANGFSFLILSLAEGGIGPGISRIARQMVATDSLDRNDLAFAKKLCRASNRPGAIRIVAIPSRRKYLGPHSGQATGCAWNRRLAGS